MPRVIPQPRGNYNARLGKGLTKRDPTRTQRLRKLFSLEMRRRWSRLFAETRRLIQDPVYNAFCPTGEGGGVDPTCSPSRNADAVRMGKVFASMPMAKATSKEAKAWRKENQLRYEADYTFRTVVDAVTLYTQGEYDVIRAFAEKSVTGELPKMYEGSSVPGWADKPIHANPISVVKTYFKDQALTMDENYEKNATYAKSGQLLQRAVENAPVSDTSLYRGLVGGSREISSLQPGDDFHIMAPSSFSVDKDIGEQFAKGINKGQGKGKSWSESGVLLEIEPGARALPAAALSPWDQKEVLTTGQFKVTDITEGRDGITRVKLKQTHSHPLVVNVKGQETRWAFEQASPFPLDMTTLNLASTQFNIEQADLIDDIKHIQSLLDPDDVVELETQPHITVRYGLHGQDADQVQQLYRNQIPLRVKLGGLSLFSSDKQDVLKIDVESRALPAIHQRLGLLPNTSTHPVYHPHLTVAYLKPGTGIKYVGESGMEGTELTFDRLVFSNDERKQTILENAFCPTGPGGGQDNSCSPNQGGGSGAVQSASDFAEQLPLDEYGNRSGTKKLGPVSVKAFRVGKVHPGNRGGVFFAGEEEGAKPYASLHEGHEVKEYTIDLKNALLAGHQNDLTKLFFNKPYGPMMDTFQRKYGRKGAHVASSAFDKKLADEARKRGYDGILYMRPAPPAKTEICVFGDAKAQVTANARTANQHVNRFIKDFTAKAYSTVKGKMWWEGFIDSGYQTGVGRAYDDVKKSVLVPADQKKEYLAGKRQFLKSAIKQSKTARAGLYDKVEEDLDRITQQLAAKFHAYLEKAVDEGRTLRDAAAEILPKIEAEALRRGENVARYRTIEAHAEGQLAAFEELGVEDISVLVEWTTTDTPCPMCEPMAGVVLRPQDAHGLIPRHVGCLCGFEVIDSEDVDEDYIADRSGIRRAIKASIKQERGGKGRLKDTDWSGIDVEIDDKPLFNGEVTPELRQFSQFAVNAFCPTGPGGGVDPTCSPPSSASQFHKEGLSLSKKWAKGLTPRYRATVDAYQAGLYQSMEGNETNSIFDKVRLGMELSVDEGNMMLRLAYAMRGSELSKPIKVYRGLGAHGSHYKVGDVVEDKAYMSTSLSRSDVEDYYANPEIYGKSTVLSLSVPKGHQAAYLDAAGGRSMGEFEVLLGKGTRFRIYEISEERDRRIVHAEVVPAWTPATTNAFCPTGPGGGQDNSCSPKHTAVTRYIPGNEQTDEQKEMYRKSVAAFASGPAGAVSGLKAKKHAVSVVEKLSREFGVPQPELYMNAGGGRTNGFYRAAGVSVLKRGLADKNPKVTEVHARIVYGRDTKVDTVAHEFAHHLDKLKFDGTQEPPFHLADVLSAVNKMELTKNQFCPTGKGGGVDPTCSPSSTTRSGEDLYSATRGKDKVWRTANGQSAPEHIQKLGIPPAWKNVEINPNPKGTTYAKGIDAKGRVQTRYSNTHTAQQAAAKFGRTRELIQKRQQIFKELDRDAKNTELKEQAECLKLVMQTGMRPGSDKDTKADHKSYGATTLEGRHVIANKDGTVTLRLVTGKNKGREVDFPVTDKSTASMLKARAKEVGPSQRLFQTSAANLRDYSKTKDGGGFKTKDHRTALGTETALRALKGMSKPTNMPDYKDKVKAVAAVVARALGNTPPIALKSYIDPQVFTAWNKGLKK